MSQAGPGSIRVQGLVHSYNGGFRLGPLDLEVGAGTRTVLAGPSGCGKTTLLRILAGLERPREGTVSLGGRLVNDPALRAGPRNRGVALVFQNLALWPHMSALKHLRFTDPSGGAARARELLERVGLSALADRRPGQLSGGEAQRLALARALASRPSILLLDEPLRSVDPLLRQELLALMRDLCGEGGLTVVLVTHDRQEALAFGQRIALLRNGRLVEDGEPMDLLRRPRTAFCASFLGGAVCWPVRLDGARAVTPFGDLDLPEGSPPGDPMVALAPHHLRVAEATAGCPGAPGRVLAAEPLGEGVLLHVGVDGREVRVAHSEALAGGQEIRLTLRGTPPLVQGEKP